MKAVQKIMLMVIICVAATWGGTRIPHVQSQSDNLGACDDEQIVQILNDINEYRTRGGLRAPFVPNETLCRLAQEHAIAIELEQTYPGDWTLRKDGTSLKEWAKATDFQPYPKDDYAVDMRLFHSTVYDYMAIVNYLVSIEPDQEAYQDFFESIEYREIGIGYVPTSEGYIYVFIVGSQPNILPVIPVYESLPYIAQYNFPSGEAQLWIADERYYTGTDLSTIGALSMMRITSTEEKEACPTIQAEIGEWQPYQSPIRHTIPAAEGQITCYVQLCDQVGRSIVMPVRVYIASTTAPVADFEAVPLQGSAPLTVRFNNKSSGNIESYSWDFNGDALADSFKEDAEYTYSQPNVYTVKLTVMGYDGMISDATQEIRVEPPVVLPEPPTAAFTANPISGPAPLVVTFQNQSTGDITAYAWDFNGDTLTDSAELNPQYRFETQGNYPVTLTVNGPGGTDTETLVINVTGSIPVEANFEMAPDQGPAPLTVVFTNTSTGEGLTYNWDFDSDSYMDSAEANPSHTYNQQGRYVVKLYVTAADGRTDSNEAIVDVLPPPTPPAPTAAFIADQTEGTAPLTVQFTNQSTGEVTEYLWDFQSNGITDANATNPGWVFETPGTYTVRLDAVGPGGTGTATIQIEVRPRPTETFTQSPTPTIEIPTAIPPIPTVSVATASLTPTNTPTFTPTPSPIDFATFTPTPTSTPTSAFTPWLQLHWNDEYIVVINVSGEVIDKELLVLLRFEFDGGFFTGVRWTSEDAPLKQLNPGACMVVYAYDYPNKEDVRADFGCALIAKGSTPDAFWTQSAFTVTYLHRSVHGEEMVTLGECDSLTTDSCDIMPPPKE